jgi:hypothetical protein
VPRVREAVAQVFREVGVPARVDAGIGRKAGIELGWVIYIAVSAGLVEFVRRFAGAAGEDAWVGLKALVRRLCEARRSAAGRRDGAIRLDARPQDAGRLTVILHDDLPDEAYRALAAGELPATGYYLWDTARGAWRGYPPGDRSDGYAAGTERRRDGPNKPE